jgi:hypothetical protein
MIFQSDGVFQACWIVKDIHEAMRGWHESKQAGPFYYAENQELLINHRGTEKKLNIDLALAQTSTVQIELIAVNSGSGSAYSDALGKAGTGFHHLGNLVADYDAALDRYLQQGFELVHEGAGPGGARYGYIDTIKSLGTMTELVERNDILLESFSRVAAAAKDWDGSDPYRPM